MKYYLIAGEKSGDLHGDNLMRSVKKRDKQALFRGFGGERMQAAGLDMLVHYREMEFFGLIGLLTHFGNIRLKIRQCKQDILAYQPHVVILIDYGGFNMQIARFCKRKKITVFYYILPKVWAWYSSRALKIKANVDRAFSILPFEKSFYQGYDYEVDYVGNPVCDAVKDFVPSDSFAERHGLDKSKSIVALLPGSRKNELRKMSDTFNDVIALHPEYTFVVAAVSSLPFSFYDVFLKHANVKVLVGATYDIFHCAHAAMVVSGTATLEAGLFRVPQVVLYKVGSVEYFFSSRLVNVKYISLVNLIADQAIIKEYVQHDATVSNLNAELVRLMSDNAYRETMIQDYGKVIDMLATSSASEYTATLIAEHFTSRGISDYII